jgi:uncharacterized OB-fold protein
MAYTKPIPVPDNISRTFWENAKAHKLLLQRCRDCGTYQSFPQSCCRRCLADNPEWIESSGKGKVYSFTIIHRPPSHSFEEDVPYIVAIIELDEGPRLMSNIIEAKPDEVQVNMRVEVIFDDINSMISLPRFRPIRS